MRGAGGTTQAQKVGRGPSLDKEKEMMGESRKNQRENESHWQ